jgi:hypothetical protein
LRKVRRQAPALVPTDFSKLRRTDPIEDAHPGRRPELADQAAFAHVLVSGQLGQLGQLGQGQWFVGPGLLSAAPVITPVDVIASKLSDLPGLHI